MNKYNFLFLPVIVFLVMSCENNKTKNVLKHPVSALDSTSKSEDSTRLRPADKTLDSVKTDRNTSSVFKGSKLKTDDFIKQYPANQQAELRSQIEWLRKEWKNVPSPLTATYQGNDFGDYFHIIFKAENGTEYDFGQANNSFGKYKLYDHLSEQLTDNPEYLGKAFKVYWDWKLAEFPCCDGEYDKAKAYLPTITKLELIKN